MPEKSRNKKPEKVIKIDAGELKKVIEEAEKKGLSLFPGRPGRGPCGGCDVVMSPRYPHYR